MNLDLLDKLKQYCEYSYIGYYNYSGNRLVDGNFSLYSLTEYKLKIISHFKKKFSNSLKIIIAESQPIDFLATFMAGIISGVNIFLGDPNWQQQEWEQVANLVTVDLVFGRSEIKEYIKKYENNNLIYSTQETDILNSSLIMIPTGGSSGKIKFAMHKWSTLKASARGFKEYFNCPKINSFCTLPLYHVSGLMQFMRSFITQGNLVIYPYKIIKNQQPQLETHTYFISLVPTQLQTLIDIIPTWLPKFHTVLLGGASISRSLLTEARNYQIPLAPTYGMTETASQVVTLKPEDFLRGNNSNGLVLPHAKIAIESDDQTKAGVIKIKSDSLCLGYYPHLFHKSPLFTTDDLGYFDEGGYLHILGRNSQKIITGGENVFPGEVEAAILETKLLSDVCIIGTSDRHWGQAVTAVYVPLDSPIDLDLIKAKIQLQLAKYKLPKHWLEVASLPRNDRGKIDYQKVKAIAAEKLIEG